MDLSFVYCEGAHDLALISKILEANTSISKSELKVKELPPVIAGLVTKGIQELDIKNVRIDKQIRPFIPQIIFKRKDSDKYILVYSLGGKTNIPDSIKNIERSKDLLKLIGGHVNHYIVIDADYIGDHLGGLDESNKYLEICLKAINPNVSLNYTNKTNQTNIFNVNIYTYIITGECGKQGALEDLLISSIQDANILSLADTFHAESTKAIPNLPCIKGRSKPIKSKLGSYTQLYEPGSSLAVGIASESLIDINKLNGNTNAVELNALIV